MSVKNKIKIIVNGKQMQVIPKFSLKSLIVKLKMPLNKIAIELNKKIIDKKRISKIQLKNGDRIIDKPFKELEPFRTLVYSLSTSSLTSFLPSRLDASLARLNFS